MKEHRECESDPLGGIINLCGCWTLNHYKDKESNFLGRLVLSPVSQCEDICKLKPIEASTLGPNIQRIDKVLREYWDEHFKPDKIERLYIVYFFETPFSPKRKGKQNLHIHLIPRTRNMGGCDPAETCAWKMGERMEKGLIPKDYCLINQDGKFNTSKVKVLMTYLRENLEEC